MFGVFADGHRVTVLLSVPKVVLHLLLKPALRTSSDEASDRRMAFGTEEQMPRRPLRSIESVLRETARPLAASVTANPRGWRH